MGMYVALVRGVGPGNPNMANDKLAAALTSIGCSEVTPLLASGNLVFRSAVRTGEQLEKKISRVFSERLGLSCDVIVRSQAELEALVKSDPFKGAEHGSDWYLTVTFHRDRQPPVFTKLARATMDGPKMMLDLERRYGKHITTRTWNTLHKILAKMSTAEAPVVKRQKPSR